jgi:site-specific DNA-methyltransferase (adenine-specific)
MHGGEGVMVNQIIQGDCLDVLRGLEDNSVGMFLCDLPYGITACHWDNVLDLDALWVELKRLIQPKRALVFTATQPFTTDLICSNRDWFKHEWVWDKVRGVGFQLATVRPMMRHENVLIFGRGGLLYNPQKTLRADVKRSKCYTSSASSPLRFNDGLTREYVDTCPTSIIEVSNAQQLGKLNPTQKPVALFEYLIRTYTNPGDVVLDPTAGSMTTAIAAMNTGRSYICIEKDPIEYQKGLKRVEEHLAKPVQFNLLDSAPAIARTAPPPQLSIFDAGVKA